MSFLSSIFRCVPLPSESARMIDSDDEDDEFLPPPSSPPHPSDSSDLNNNNNNNSPILNNSPPNHNSNNNEGSKSKRIKKEKMVELIQQLKQSPSFEQTLSLLHQSFELIEDLSLKYSTLMRIFSYVISKNNNKNNNNNNNNNNNGKMNSHQKEVVKDLIKKVISGLEEEEKKDLLACLQYLPSSTLGDAQAKNESRVFIDIIEEIHSAHSHSPSPSYLNKGSKGKGKSDNDLAEIYANILVTMVDSFSSPDNTSLLLSRLLSSVPLSLTRLNIVAQQILLSDILPANIEERSLILLDLFN